MPEAGNSNHDRDLWDKLDILLKPIGGIVAGVVIGGIGYWSTQVLQTQQVEETRRQEQRQIEETRRQQQQQAEETNRRLYTELMSSREKADSDLRKEMFNAIIGAFLTSEKTSLAEKVLALELLAYNFHDVIDLSPLFKHIATAIDEHGGEDENENEDGPLDKERLKSQLERVAREVTDKQLAALGDVGATTELTVNFKHMNEAGIQPLSEACYPLRSPDTTEKLQRYIYLEALDLFPDRRELKLHLESGVVQCDPPDPNAVRKSDTDINFEVGFFDFPMIDNTRVTNAQRIAVALTHWDNAGANLKLVYFPGSRASLKEKPYYEEVIQQLRRTKAALQEGG